MNSKHDKHKRRRRKGKARGLKFWILFVVTPIIVSVGLSLAAYAVYVKKQSSGKQGIEQALIYANLNRHTEALDVFKKELEKNPENPNIHYYMGISYLKLKDYDKAIYEFKKAIKTKPNFSNARLQLV